MIRIFKDFKDLNNPRKHDFKELEDSKDLKDPMRFFVRDWNKYYSYVLFIYSSMNCYKGGLVLSIGLIM